MKRSKTDTERQPTGLDRVKTRYGKREENCLRVFGAEKDQYSFGRMESRKGDHQKPKYECEYEYTK